MTTMTMLEAKRDRANGYLRTYQVQRYPQQGTGWFVWLGSGNHAGWLVDSRDREPREFRNLDTAVKALEVIGFEVKVLLCNE